MVLQHFMYSGFDRCLTVFIVKSDALWNTFACLCIKYRSLTHQLHQIISRFLYMEYTNNKMKSETSCDDKIQHDRCMAFLYILRLGGISFNIKSLSKLNALYNVVCVVCAYITLLCVIMDVFVHRHDLVQVLKKLPVILGISLVVWIHFCLRYVT